jgi:hypothetical protein
VSPSRDGASSADRPVSWARVDARDHYPQDCYVDADYPILDNRRSKYWVYRSLWFMADHGLTLRARVGFLWYVPVAAGASSFALLSRVPDNADATPPSRGLQRTYGIAET